MHLQELAKLSCYLKNKNKRRDNDGGDLRNEKVEQHSSMVVSL